MSPRSRAGHSLGLDRSERAPPMRWSEWRGLVRIGREGPLALPERNDDLVALLRCEPVQPLGWRWIGRRWRRWSVVGSVIVRVAGVPVPGRVDPLDSSAGPGADLPAGGVFGVVVVPAAAHQVL